MRDSQPVRASLLTSGVTDTGVHPFMKLLNDDFWLMVLERLDGAAGAAVHVCVLQHAE